MADAAAVSVKEAPPEALPLTLGLSDEAAVNVRVVNRRWPDCTSLASAVADIFRLEEAKTEQERALALWRWQRVLVDHRGWTSYDGPPGDPTYLAEPHKLLTVFGNGHCDPLTRITNGLWVASGRIASKGFAPLEYHTQAKLFYRDDDGQKRFHMFDQRYSYFGFDRGLQRVLSMEDLAEDPILGGSGPAWVHCSEPPPTEHSGHTSLRVGESVERRWDSDGYIYRCPRMTEAYYDYPPSGDGEDSITSVAGQEIQTLEVDTSVGRFGEQLFALSDNTASSPSTPGGATLHPADASREAAFVYRMAPPYVIVDAEIEATLVRSHPQEAVALSFSVDGGQVWHECHNTVGLGEETVRISIGQEALGSARASAVGFYDLLVRATVKSRLDDRSSAGVRALRITCHRQLNKRTLPNLREGANPVTVYCDRLAPGYALELVIRWREPEGERRVVRRISRFPYRFTVDTAPIPSHVERDWPVPPGFEQTAARRKLEYLIARMISLEFRVVPARDLPHAEAEPQPPAAGSEGLADLFGPVSPPEPVALPESLEALLQHVRRPGASPREIILGLEAVARLGTDAAFSALRDEAASSGQSNRPIRRTAILALAKFPDTDEAVAALLSLLEGQERATVVTSLGLTRSRGATQALLAVLTDADQRMRVRAAHSLGQIGDPAAYEVLADALERTDPAAYAPDGWAYVQALGRIAGRRAVSTLLARLRSGARGDLLQSIARELGRIGDAEAAGELLAHLDPQAPGAAENWAIVEALGQLRHAPAGPVLAEMLPRARVVGRFHVVRALGMIGGEEAIAALRDAAEHDPHPAIREEAAQALLGVSERVG